MRWSTCNRALCVSLLTRQRAGARDPARAAKEQILGPQPQPHPSLPTQHLTASVQQCHDQGSEDQRELWPEASGQSSRETLCPMMYMCAIANSFRKVVRLNAWMRKLRQVPRHYLLNSSQACLKLHGSYRWLQRVRLHEERHVWPPLRTSINLSSYASTSASVHARELSCLSLLQEPMQSMPRRIA